MHDVIIDDTKSSFAAVNSVQRERKPQKKRSFSGYLVDWVEKALIIACLISIDFLAFAGAGSYQMFDHSTFLTLEVWYIIAGIFAASVLLMYILSFSSFFPFSHAGLFPPWSHYLLRLCLTSLRLLIKILCWPVWSRLMFLMI